MLWTGINNIFRNTSLMMGTLYIFDKPLQVLGEAEANFGAQDNVSFKAVPCCNLVIVSSTCSVELAFYLCFGNSLFVTVNCIRLFLLNYRYVSSVSSYTAKDLTVIFCANDQLPYICAVSVSSCTGCISRHWIVTAGIISVSVTPSSVSMSFRLCNIIY